MTNRLVLRPWTPEDFEAYWAMSSDPEVMRYIGRGQPDSRADAEKKFGNMSQSWDEHGFGLLALEILDDPETGPIGFAGLLIPDFLPEILPAVELGWRLRASAWGHGYATEAAGSVMDWAFGTLGIDRLVSVIQQDNDRSRRVAQKLGMLVERRTVVPSARAWVEVYERLGPTREP